MASSLTRMSRAPRLLLLASLLFAAATTVARAQETASSAPAPSLSAAEEQALLSGEESIDADGASECHKEALEDYNLGLHIGSIFIMMAVSAMGGSIPVLLHISTNHTTITTLIKLGTFFGFGTILSTAFIHMLTPAQYNLSSPCLSASWLETYEAWAALFCVLSIVVMQALDFVIEGAYKAMLARRRRAAPRSVAGATIHSSHAVLDLAATQTGAASRTGGKGYIVPEGDEEAGDADCRGSGCGGHGQFPAAAAGGDEHEHGAAGACAEHGGGCKHLLAHAARRDADPSQVVGIYLMEAGIVFHSVVIGITLGVAAGNSFTTLFIALCMHQFFEGFAIGSASVDTGLGWAKSAVLVGIYSLTTPVGIAIGIGIRETFNENSAEALMVEGILDAISAGILIYVVLVELMTPLMTQSAWLREQRWWMQCLSFACFWGGVTVLAVIGKWA